MTVLTAGSVSDKICRYASSIMAPEEKPNMAYLLLTATQKKGLQGSGQG
ncbi:MULTISPECIES: hypothetical protein [Enterobacteriaceae]|nr:hypothetical protein [Citrobacter freundii]